MEGKSRLRRAKSVTKAEEIQEEEAKERQRQPDKPKILERLLNYWPEWLQEDEYTMEDTGEREPHVVHRHADSFFSTSSGFTNYRGLLNLCIVLLILSNTRLFLENILKYGILIDPIAVIHAMSVQPYSWPNIILILLSNVFILTTFYTESALAKAWLSERIAFVIHTITLILVICFPASVILYRHPNPVFSVITLSWHTMLFMKLISYMCVNKWCRDFKSTAGRRRKTISLSENTSRFDIKQNGVSQLVMYPDNLNYSDMYYFMAAPTLCYELNFPRSARIRKRFLLKRLMESVFMFQLMLGLIQQWMTPLINNSMKPLEDMDISKVVERLLKLAIPNHFIWLIFFYWFFHSCLNVCAEILRFGDREFYRDWWNAETISYFWSNWNVPVHRWASRHLYKPLLRRGYTKQVASIAVFFASAFFHEYLVSVPLRMFRVWSFTAMLGQIPLATFMAVVLSGKYGNMMMWVSLILGQPVAILAYVHDYYVMHSVLPSS